MKRYLKLFLAYTKVNIKSLSVYKKDFFFGVAAMALKNLLNFITIFFIFELTSLLSGWTVEQMVLLYGGSLISFLVWRCFFIHTISVPYFIKSGSFDDFLAKPMGVLFQLMVYGFDEDAWGDLIVSVFITVAGIYANKISFYNGIILFVSFVISTIIYISFSLFFSSLSLRTNGEMNFSSLNYTIAKIVKYPLHLFPVFIQFVFTYFLPLGIISYYSVIHFIKNFRLFSFTIYLTIISLFFLFLILFGIVHLIIIIAPVLKSSLMLKFLRFLCYDI